MSVAVGGARVRWAAIALVVLVPWLVTDGLLSLRRDFYSGLYRKVPLLAAMPNADTLVAGDSRVLRVSSDPMRARGWVPFNFGLSAANAEDVAMEVRYTLDHAPIRRAIIGLNFANMSDPAPFATSGYVDEWPFSARETREFAELEPGSAARRPTPTPPSGPTAWILPVSRATVTLHGIFDRWSVLHEWDGYYPDGRIAYVSIRRQLDAGTFDVERERNPEFELNRPGGEYSYRRNPRLAPHVQAVYRRIFNTLAAQGIPVVAFETGHAARYRAVIDGDPLLAQLAVAWRSFFRSMEGPCVKFLDRDDLGDAYRAEDFFDAAHFVGPTEERLGRRLSDDLAQAETACTARGGAK